MKILFITNAPDSKTAGMAKIMHCLADELNRRGHSVDLLFQESVGVFKENRRLHEFFFPLLMMIPILKMWQRGGSHDIVAIHSLEAGFYVFLRLFIKSLPPCVMVSYGHDEMRWNLEKEEERLGFRKLSLFSKIFYYHMMIGRSRFATRYADHVMVTARTEITYNKEKYGVPESRMSFIPNGVAPEYFHPKEYAQNPVKLLYLGGWEWRKGIRYLARAFSIASAKHQEIRLTLAGIGVGESTAKEMFPPECRDKITVISKIPFEQIPGVYQAHDVFVFPSLFESMSLVVPEAMASGLPVITTRACGMQDIVEDGGNGMLVPPRNPELLALRIMELIENPDLAKKLGLAAQQSAGNLTWQRVADQVLEMYAKVLRTQS